VSDFVLDASLALQWFLEDEADRKYSLAVLASLSEKRALIPLLPRPNPTPLSRSVAFSQVRISSILSRMNRLSDSGCVMAEAARG
jgi:hypothetical protein